MIICDYCGKDCRPDHSDYRLDAYRWNYSGYYHSPHNVLHFHKWCYDEIIDAIHKHKRSAKQDVG